MADLTIVTAPHTYFADFSTGRPIFNGQIYVGEPDTDPEIPGNQKQITVRQEDLTEIPVGQPMTTSPGGQPEYNGSPVDMLVDGNYSIKVLDRFGAQVYYIANFFNGTPVTTNDVTLFIFDTAADLKASSMTPGANGQTNGLDILLDGGNAEYYVQSLAQYGGVPPDETTSPDIYIPATNCVAVKLADSVLPLGAIVMYSGSYSVIPEGWTICDGLNDTPDLRNRFIIGATSDIDLDTTGGSADILMPNSTDNHTLTGAQSGTSAHSHGANMTNSDSRGAPVNGSYDGGGSLYEGNTAASIAANAAEGHNHDITFAKVNANLPPYYTLAFIMRTGVIKQVISAAPPEQAATYENVSGVVELDSVGGTITVFTVIPNGAITDLSVINLPAAVDTAYMASIKIVGGGVAGVVFNPQFNWTDDTPPDLTTDSLQWDWLVAVSTDEGVILDASYAIGPQD